MTLTPERLAHVKAMLRDFPDDWVLAVQNNITFGDVRALLSAASGYAAGHAAGVMEEREAVEQVARWHDVQAAECTERIAGWAPITFTRRLLEQKAELHVEAAAAIRSRPAPSPHGVTMAEVAAELAMIGGVLRFDLREMVEWGPKYNQAAKDAHDRVTRLLARLSPAKETTP